MACRCCNKRLNVGMIHKRDPQTGQNLSPALIVPMRMEESTFFIHIHRPLVKHLLE